MKGAFLNITTYSAFWDQKYDINKSNRTVTTSLTQLNVCYVSFNHIQPTWQITGVKKSKPHMLWRKKKHDLSQMRLSRLESTKYQLYSAMLQLFL